MDISSKISSRDFYNKTAQSYRKIYQNRLKYNNKVDDIIIERNANQVKSILDVGCGNGERGIKIHKLLKSKYILLLEESEEMISEAPVSDDIISINSSIENFITDQKFDLIICLWNVFGHIKNKKSRINTLKKMKNLLNENGRIFIDFNNRFNCKYYGIINCLKNLVKSILNKESGWFNLTIGESKTKVYIHSYSEILELIRSSGLTIESVTSIDYETGTIHKSKLKGQLLFSLKI